MDTVRLTALDGQDGRRKRFASLPFFYLLLNDSPGLRPGDAKPVDGVGARFLLTVGSVGDRKNQARCIEFLATRFTGA